MIKYKKAGTMTNWLLTVMLILLFLVILQSQVLDNMNTIYNTSYQTGLNTSGLNSFTTLKGTMHNETSGTVSQTSDGLTLTSTWTMGKASYQTLVDFINGNFISTLFEQLDFPPIVATTITVMIWISLILIIIYIFMKVIP